MGEGGGDTRWEAEDDSCTNEVEVDMGVESTESTHMGRTEGMGGEKEEMGATPFCMGLLQRDVLITSMPVRIRMEGVEGVSEGR